MIANVAVDDVGTVTLETLGIKEGSSVVSAIVKNNTIIAMETVNNLDYAYYMKEEDSNLKKISKESYESLLTEDPSYTDDLEEANEVIQNLNKQLEEVADKLKEVTGEETSPTKEDIIAKIDSLKEKIDALEDIRDSIIAKLKEKGVEIADNATKMKYYRG